MKNLSKSKRYQDAKAYTESMKLPIGAYKLHIVGVKYLNNNGYSDQIEVSFDISDGEYAGFYSKKYKADTNEDKRWKGNFRIWVPEDDGSEKDEWTMRKFKTIMNAFEESNPGYVWNWDEQTLKGKTIGGVFNEREYDNNGNTGFYTACHSLIPIGQIETATIPGPTYLDKNKNKSGSTPQPSPAGDGFMNIPEGIDQELPFN